MTHTRRRDTRGLEYDSLDSDLNSIIDSTQRRSFPRRFYQKLRGSKPRQGSRYFPPHLAGDKR